MPDSLHSILNSAGIDLQLPKLGQMCYGVRQIKTSQCQTACPIDTRVKAYLGLIAAGEFDKAVEVVKRDNPFPGVCGRVCIHPCENECERNSVDEPLAICSLKRFLADYEFKHGRQCVGKKQKVKHKKVAIVGAGPAGLTAANDLARTGYNVTVFEAAAEPGGMLLYGIPSFRLPKDIVRFEIEGIKELGVDIRTNTRIGTDLPLEKLKDDYDAVLLSIGAHNALKPNLPGVKENAGIIDFLALSKKINMGEKIETGESIVFFGGDRATIDTARGALRAGFGHAAIIYSRSISEMPVDPSQILAAEEEGVKIYYQTVPVKILGENGKVVGVECLSTELDKADRIGRKKPIPVEGSNFNIKADKVTSVFNREPEVSSFKNGGGFEFTIFNTFMVEPDTLFTKVDNVFAAGDCATGPKTTIEAIASGQKAARSIVNFLSRKNSNPAIEQCETVEYEVVLEHKGHKERAEMPKLLLPARGSLEEVELGFSEQQAIAEAKRCLKCGPCQECDICNSDCNKRLTVLYPHGETSGSLLRVHSDSELFPINGSPLEGQIFLNREPQKPVNLAALRALVNSEMCRGCGDCVEVCLYSAPKLSDQGDGVYISKIDEILCRGCGVCPSVCPSSAIEINYFSDLQLDRLTTKALEMNKIVGFICNWAHEKTADLEEISGVNMIRVLCSARINPTHIIKAFKQGAEGVLGIGCYEKACHYEAIKETSEHFEVAKNILKTLGVNSQRLKFERLSPDQPDKLDKLIRSFCKNVKELK